MSSPTQRNRARRKDPFRRAQRAPVKAVAPVPCPNGGCPHVDMLHERLTDEQKPRAELIRCTVCDCREIRWPDEESE